MNLGITSALSAALLFGASPPFIKSIIGDDVSPILIAGILYFASGIGMFCILLFRKFFRKIHHYAPIKKSDRKWLFLAILCGGIIAPILLMMAISLISATNASLLLNLESVFTALLAWFAFKENFDLRVLLGIIAIVMGGVFLSVNNISGNYFSGFSSGSLFVIGACFFWGLDNNFSQKISASDPVIITTLKGIVAGIVNLIIGYFLISKIPNLDNILKISVIGFLSYGLSMALLIKSLNLIGAARTGAYFGTAPFIGALISVTIFHEPVTINLIIAAILMAIGVCIQYTENHKHIRKHHSHT